jgi:hypothetical protein
LGHHVELVGNNNSKENFKYFSTTTTMNSDNSEHQNVQDDQITSSNISDTDGDVTTVMETQDIGTTTPKGGSKGGKRVCQDQTVSQSCFEQEDGVAQTTSPNASATEGSVNSTAGKRRKTTARGGAPNVYVFDNDSGNGIPHELARHLAELVVSGKLAMRTITYKK